MNHPSIPSCGLRKCQWHKILDAPTLTPESRHRLEEKMFFSIIHGRYTRHELEALKGIIQNGEVGR